MSDVGQIERRAQTRVANHFQHQLGYDPLGNWQYRGDNASIEQDLLTANLTARGYDDNLTRKAITQLQKAGALGGGRDLYEANRDVYNLLRYGVKVKPGIGEHTETVWLIDWDNPDANHFAFAEEVTVTGPRTKRPDIVLYLNGIAVATIELKRSTVSVGDGIRQTIGNQRKDFIRPFFTTVQLVFAGNDVEGLRYGTIDTPEKYWLSWRELSDIDDPLDRALTQTCSKARLLELIHDFTVFDAGVRKVCRHNQYFGVKAAQGRIAERDGGIIWHTQGSGKSLTMVWLAKWIRENQPDARVLLITDRTELDDQIEQVFNGVNEQIYRTTSGTDLLDTLATSDRWLICSLVHKFQGGSADDDDQDGEAFLAALDAAVPDGFEAKGNIFVFVDEAHRTQSGRMHAAMQALLPDAMFIGFTGTPLLKADKATSIETFGSFIHTYKLNEAVADGVVLDLRYEARQIDQRLSSQSAVDAWFNSKTAGMTDLSRAELKKRWGTMKRVVSAEPRARQIVNDILLDMMQKPRLADGRGNAILVSASIYQACKFYELFAAAGPEGKCAIVTSYEPNAGSISKEDSGEGKTEKIRQYDIYRKMLAAHFNEPEDAAMHKVDQFEQEVKATFVNDPGQMRLLIVVDRLLTGFDAPPATYLYIDKSMRDHGLFQAICRVNRLDGDDKEYGYIVDYQDLFNSLEAAVTDYTSGAFDGYDDEDVDGLVTNRVEKAAQDLDDAMEALRALCEPVARPKGTRQYQQYFCAKDDGNAEQLKANEPKRVELYKAVAAAVRSFSALANDMAEAGYASTQTESLREEINHFVNVRHEVKLGANEDVDFKQYEAGMRFLLDTYIQAGASEIVSDFEDVGLVELIAQLGLAGAVKRLPQGIRDDQKAVAETIANNVRKVIIDEHAMNPKYYETMSDLLDALIEQRRQDNLTYAEYLAKLGELAKKVSTQESDTKYPHWADNGAKKALVDFFLPDAEVAIEVDAAVMRTKPDSWVGNTMKEKMVKVAMIQVLPTDFDRLNELLDLVKARHEYH